MEGLHKLKTISLNHSTFWQSFSKYCSAPLSLFSLLLLPCCFHCQQSPNAVVLLLDPLLTSRNEGLLWVWRWNCFLSQTLTLIYKPRRLATFLLPQLQHDLPLSFDCRELLVCLFVCLQKMSCNWSMLATRISCKITTFIRRNNSGFVLFSHGKIPQEKLVLLW